MNCNYNRLLKLIVISVNGFTEKKKEKEKISCDAMKNVFDQIIDLISLAYVRDNFMEECTVKVN